MNNLLWLIPVLPLAGFLINGLANKRLPVNVSGWIASLTVFGSFVISLNLFVQLTQSPDAVFQADYFQWLKAGAFELNFGFLVDRLSVIMLLVITGVGFLIHVYSIGYMHNEPDYARYFAYLNLFVFFMLLLVLGSSYVLMFVGWEGVGLCSYLLIGFWFKNNNYNDAAKKAFIMNRVGDLGFLLGMFLIFQTFGSLDYKTVFSGAMLMKFDEPVITAITLLLFVGAIGKSAQLPLYTWLPDAMAGPTPVSALIHAATMVTAGIYMVVRSNVLYVMAPFSSEIIAIIGLATAFVAALIGLKQTDIKKVLAYSTVSQLGFMVVALGVGAYTTALFHVVTHAFFKALLFLGAGSVIHAMGGEQDIRKMGALKKALPVTHLTFLIGTLAIAGAPPFAGFFSKDEILAKSFVHSPFIFAVLAITAVLTAVYMFRLYFLTFHGAFRGSKHQHDHLHESPVSMTVPLILLAVLSTVGGFVGLPEIFHAPHLLNDFLQPIVAFANSYHFGEVSHTFEYVLIGSTLVILAVVIYGTYNKYVTHAHVPQEETQLNGLQKVLANKFYIDEFYDAVITKPMNVLSKFSYEWIEKGFIDRIVNSFGQMTNGAAGLLKFTQSGHLGIYLFGMVIAIIVLLVFKLVI
ncbi:MAG: NADH-quinone oxidoreductase subunit L [Bacteroidetes bacterium]|nr:NADH-quinone oxidoreductase subunit L [Bacteroidota bacterium]